MRLRENQRIGRDGYTTWPLARHAQGMKRGQKRLLKGLWRLGASDLRVRIVLMRLKTGELLALATSGRPSRALARYRQRWPIETMFGNLKTRGFDLEVTHMTDLKKLETLLVLTAIAVALAAKTGASAERVRPIPVKKHGRRTVSIFALGLATLRKIFTREICDQINSFLKALMSPKLPPKALIQLGFENESSSVQ